MYGADKWQELRLIDYGAFCLRPTVITLIVALSAQSGNTHPIFPCKIRLLGQGLNSRRHPYWKELVSEAKGLLGLCFVF